MYAVLPFFGAHAAVAGNLTISPGGRLTIAGATVNLNGGDLRLDNSSSLVLTAGAVTNIFDVTLSSSAATIIGPGRLSLTNRWINQSSFVLPTPPDAEILIDSPISEVVNLSPGVGDTDNDGVPDNIEGSGDDNLNGLPNFLDSESDTDDDGMPDAWETAFGFNPTNQNDATLDFDNDGATNLDEYFTDTSPVELDSVVKIRAIGRTNNQTTLEWSGGEIVAQYLQWAPSLQGPWTTVYTNMPPTTLNESLQIQNPPTEDGIYRIVVEKSR